MSPPRGQQKARLAMHSSLAPAVPSAPVAQVTVDDRLAGLLLEDAGRLRFVAVDRRYDVLDGSRFYRRRDAQLAAERIARLTRREPGSPLLGPGLGRARSLRV